MQPTDRTRTGSGASLRHFSIHFAAFFLILLVTRPYGETQDESGYTFDAGAGFSPLVSDISRRLDNGWHVTFGGGYNFTSHFTTTLNYAYHGFGVRNKVLAEANVPDGNAHLWSITVDPKLRLSPRNKIDLYVVGGVGYYRRTVEFTRPVILSVVIFDPFFGGFFNTLVRTNQVLGDITRDGIGGSLGGGFDVKLRETGLKVFAEARYHYADTGRVATRMVPLTVGIRW